MVLAKLGHDGRSYYRLLASERKNLSDDARRLIELYAPGAIAYQFKFDITEENNLSGGTDFLDTLTRGTLTLDVSGKSDKKRQSVRTFNAVDTFGQIMTDQPLDRVCDSKPAIPTNSAPNLVYPIKGSLNLKEILGTFISLNQSGNLVGNPDAKDVEARKIPTLTDELTFTTTLSGTINPVIKLNAVGKNFQLVGADLNFVNTRTDVHRLVLAITLPQVRVNPRDGKPTIAQRRSARELRNFAVDALEAQRRRRIDDETEIIRDKLLQ